MSILFANQTDDVKFQHPQYIEHYNQVHMLQNIYKGIDSAKQYIKKAPMESETSFIDRQNSATVKNFVKRAVEAFVGMIFRKDVDASGYDEKLDAFFKKIDTKNDLNKFSRDLAASLIRDGKAYIAVDTPIGGGDPYMAIIGRQRVTNWRKDLQGRYTMLVAYEAIERAYGDYGLEVVERWRVYRDDGSVEIWEEDSTGLHLADVIQTEFNYIPIIDLDLSDVPMLYDIAKMTIKHMNRTSFKDKYLDMSAIPIPLIWGVSADEGDSTGKKPAYVIGVDEAFVFSGTKDESDFQWRELSGSSIKALQDDLKIIEEDITSGVIKATVAESTTIKTATQSFYEAAESSNRVTMIAVIIEAALNQAVAMMADMANITVSPDARIRINKDFNGVTQDPNALRLLWEVYLSGGLSIETFLKSLESYEVIDIGSVDNELERIKNDTFAPHQRDIGQQTAKQMDNNLLSQMNIKK